MTLYRKYFILSLLLVGYHITKPGAYGREFKYDGGYEFLLAIQVILFTFVFILIHYIIDYLRLNLNKTITNIHFILNSSMILLSFIWCFLPSKIPKRYYRFDTYSSYYEYFKGDTEEAITELFIYGFIGIQVLFFTYILYKLILKIFMTIWDISK